MNRISRLRLSGAGVLLSLVTVLMSTVITTQSAQAAATFDRLYSFCSQPSCTDGDTPRGGLIQATDGNLYGTTNDGGSNGFGTVFKITPSGTLTTLYNFCSEPDCPDGTYPETGVIQATDGNFYGTTGSTVFKITPSGTLIFDVAVDGVPNGLIQASDGNFYGTTYFGGANSDGTVFKITPSGGTLTTLYSFCSKGTYPDCTDGDVLYAGLVQGADGNFYGTTTNGGANSAGTVFKITPSGKFATLYSFCSQPYCTDGSNPEAGLIQATDGNFYGTTPIGGAYKHHWGTVFKITPGGALTTPHSFGKDRALGNGPVGLMQATNGNFYGMTHTGGTSDDGTIFRLSVGLGPFVETQTTSGTVGSVVVILGNNLTGASSVTFHGIAATFAVVSDTEITATVPTGATTGFVEVKTLDSTVLKSNTKFMVP